MPVMWKNAGHLFRYEWIMIHNLFQRKDNRKAVYSSRTWLKSSLILESQFVYFGIQETRFEFSIADLDTIVWSWLVTVFKGF